jgi:hypothetical protein
MTSQLKSLIQQATQLDRDERIELITHVANSLHSNNDSTLANTPATKTSKLDRFSEFLQAEGFYEDEYIQACMTEIEHK